MEPAEAPTMTESMADEPDVAREIRHAVYMTGGLVLLAFGVNDMTTELGPVLSCLWRTNYCPGNFSNSSLVYQEPAFVGGLFLVGVAILLLISARRTLRRLPPLF
jgi:hypothetical protein